MGPTSMCHHEGELMCVASASSKTHSKSSQTLSSNLSFCKKPQQCRTISSHPDELSFLSTGSFPSSSLNRHRCP